MYEYEEVWDLLTIGSFGHISMGGIPSRRALEGKVTRLSFSYKEKPKNLAQSSL